MTVLSVRLEDAEYQALNKYAKANGISMNKALKEAFFEMLEEKYDLELFNQAYADYLKNPTTYTTDEVCEKLGIKLRHIM